MGCYSSTPNVSIPNVYRCRFFEKEHTDIELLINLEKNHFHFQKTGTLFECWRRQFTTIEVGGTIHLDPHRTFTLTPRAFEIEHKTVRQERIFLRKMSGKSILSLGDIFADEPLISSSILSFLPCIVGSHASYQDHRMKTVDIHCCEIVFHEAKSFIQGRILEDHVEITVPWLFGCRENHVILECLPIQEKPPPNFHSKVDLVLKKVKESDYKPKMSPEEIAMEFGS